MRSSVLLLAASLAPTSAEAGEAAKQGEENEIVLHKRFLLNQRFFQVRLVLYLFLWFFLADKYFGWSSEQDKSEVETRPREFQADLKRDLAVRLDAS